VIRRDRRKIHRKPLPLLAYGAIMMSNDSKGGAA
jgi:hypothetical protein